MSDQEYLRSLALNLFNAYIANVSAALKEMVRVRDAVLNGQADRLAVEVKKFCEAADEFLRWAERRAQR